MARQESDTPEGLVLIDLDLNTFGKKKKKNRNKTFNANIDAPENQTTKAESPNDIFKNEDDYTYEELLSRVYATIREKNPELIKEEEVRKTVLRPPQLARLGGIRRVYANFSELCQT